MTENDPLSELTRQYLQEVTTRVNDLAAKAQAGEFDAAIDLMTDAIAKGGVVQAFGTGHSEAFAMEIAGRAGGLIPTNKMALRDVVVHGSRHVEDLDGSELVRSPAVVDELFDLRTMG
jgi:uncharacterized phosphosugar-binding protein